MNSLVIAAAVAANVVNGLVSERTGTVYPARARTEIRRDGDVFRIAVESALAPEGLSRRVLPAEGGPSRCVGVDDCVYFACGGRRFMVNANGAWCGDRPDGFSSDSSATGGAWRVACVLPAAFCRGGLLTVGRRFAYGGEKYGRDASIELDPKTFGDPDFIPPIEDATYDPSDDPFRRDGSVADRFVSKFAYYPRYNMLRVKCDVTRLPGWRDAARIVDCAVSDRKGAKVAGRALAVGGDGIADETFEIPDLKARTVACGAPEYTLTLSVRGVAGAVHQKGFVRHVMEWEGNRYGLSGVVLPPFTPVEVRRPGARGGTRTIDSSKRVSLRPGDVVSTVLREHTVGEFGLWRQVRAAGRDLLARPMALRGGRLPPGLRAVQTYDYDGLMEWRLVIPPGRCGPIDLEIPFRQDVGRLMNACVDNIRCNYCGVVPAGKGFVWNGKMARGRSGLLGDYVPYIWIGGPLRGIAVFGENDRGWLTAFNTKKDPKDDPSLPPCQEIVREPDGTVTLVLHLVQGERDVESERTIRIGFQATPVKPMHPDFRRPPSTSFLGSCNQWGAGPADSATETWDGTDEFFLKMAEARRTGALDLAYVSNCVERMVYPGLPGSREWNERKSRLSAFMTSGMRCAQNAGKRKGSNLLWYMNGRGVVFGNKSGATFADQWSREEFLTVDREFTPMSHRDYELDPDEDFRDYSAWWYRLMAKSGAMDFLYWDDTYASPNFDLVGTDAYRLADGRIQPACGIFNLRLMIKRAACVQAELGRESRWNWIHETNAAMAPISAFVGVHYDWEDNTRGMSFQKRYPKDYMLAGVVGRQFGVRVSVIGYYGCPETKEKEEWFKRTGAGWCLAHEISWRHAKAQEKLLEDWGWRRPDTKVWNYWDEDSPIPLRAKGLSVATLAMSRADGECLLVVSNAEDSGGKVALTVDRAKMGLRKGFGAVDLETGSKAAVSGDTVELELDGDDYAIIALR